MDEGSGRTRSHDSSQRRVLLDADEFATRYNLDQFRDVLRVGALSITGSSTSEHLEGLTPAEEKGIILRHGRPKQSWRSRQQIPPQVFRTRIFPFCWAFFLGCRFYPLLFPYTFTGGTDFTRSRSFIKYCAPYICSALFGCWCTPLLNQLWGRRGAMTAGSTCVFIAEVSSVLSFSFWMHWLLVLIFGLGIGVTTCTTLIYMAEIVPLSHRGVMASEWYPVAIAGLCDIMLSLLTTSEHVWKIFRICGLVFTGFLPIVPRLSAESPRWCVAHGHIQKAFQCLRSLHETDVAAAEELYRIYARIRIESQTSGHDGLQRRFVELLTVPEIRRTYLASTAVAISGCLSGPGFTFAMFSLSIFDIDEGIVDRNQLLLKLLMSTTIVNATMLSSFSMSTIVKRRRRRFCVGLFLLFLSFLVSWFRFLVPTIYYLIPSLVTVVLSFVTVVISAFGSGAVPSVYVAEIFPTYYHREFGVALSVAIYQGCQVLLGVFVGSIYRFISPVLIVLLCWLMVFLLMEESQHLTLEEMHSAFQHSTRARVSYRLFTQVPYAFKRYVLRKKVRLQPTEDRNVGYTYTPYTDEEAISLAS